MQKKKNKQTNKQTKTSISCHALGWSFRRAQYMASSVDGFWEVEPKYKFYQL